MHDGDPFLRHIVLLLSVYEIGTKAAPPPIWHGPETWQTISITRAIKALGERLWMAEEAMRSLQRSLAKYEPDAPVSFPAAVPPLDAEFPSRYGYFPRIDGLGDSLSSVPASTTTTGHGSGKPDGGSTASKPTAEVSNNINKLFVVDHTFTPLGASKETSSTTKNASSPPSKSSRNKTWKSTTNSTTKQPSATVSPSSSSSSTPTPRSTKTVPNSKPDKNSPSASASPATNGGSSGSTTRPSLSLGTLPPTLDSNHYANLQPNHIAHAQALASNGSSSGSTSAPPTSHAFCPTCGKTISDPMVLPLYAGYGVIRPYAVLTAGIVNGYGLGPFGLGPLGGTAGMGNGEGGDADSSGINSSGSSPMIVPSMGPLAHAAFESGMSAVEELTLLKAQVQDVARVCNTVAKGDLSQKIIVPVQGVLYFRLPRLSSIFTHFFGIYAGEWRCYM
ncbi:hypothetical protein AN958_01913 [Leucoagaricus sp. SymC.cos]|nr:hypothetical protein AN958_01913 [Leucoagaricus sp. SymC.cos]